MHTYRANICAVMLEMVNTAIAIICIVCYINGTVLCKSHSVRTPVYSSLKSIISVVNGAKQSENT